MSPPVGPTGLPEYCDGSEPLSPWKLGASGGWFSTDIDFGDRTESLTETSVLAVASYQVSPTFAVELGAGAILDGAIGRAGAADGDVGTGFALSASVSLLALLETERRPFLLLGASVAGSRTDALADDGERHTLGAVDVRLGAMAGKTFGPVTPYLAARGFGGPVSWTIAGDDVTGSDSHHYTIGAGASLRLGRRLTLAAELLPLGEKSAAATATVGL